MSSLETKQQQKRQEAPMRKWAKINKQFTERETKKADRSMKRFPKLLVIRWMYVKTQHHCAPIQLAKIRKPGSNQCWGGWGDMGSFKWEGQWPFLKKIEKLTCLTHNPILDTSAGELSTKHRRGRIQGCSSWPRICAMESEAPKCPPLSKYGSKRQLTPTVESLKAGQRNDADGA